jgi:hypothetical protein
MSIPASRPPAPANLTRQQLDELDALLQQMLELPVQQNAEDSGASRPAGTAGSAVLEAEPVISSGPVATLSGVPLTADGPRSASPRRERPARSPEPVGDAQPRPVALWLRPLQTANQLFDVHVARLGRPGRWLCRPQGRAFLGWMGLALLVGALGLMIYDRIR